MGTWPEDVFTPGRPTRQRLELLRGLLRAGEFEKIVQIAGNQRRVLSYLTAISYEDDLQISQRAIEAIGMAAARLADDDPEYVRVHLRRQMWLLSDESGGIGWHAPEIMGEIVYHRAQFFAEFIPLIISILDMEAEDAERFRRGALYAIGRLAHSLPPQELARAKTLVTPCLNDQDAQIGEMARWCLEKLSESEINGEKT
jgi:hypothetical protein